MCPFAFLILFMTKLIKNDIIELEITDIAFGGDGVGRVDGCVVFVPFTIIGETVRAKIFRRKKRFYFADLIEVLKPSPERLDPFCQYYQKCGGCQYQHINYNYQLKIFKKQLKDIMTRLGNFEPEELNILDLLPSPRTKNYRNRIDLHQCGETEYGFCVKNFSRQKFPLKKCKIFELEDDFSEFPERRPEQLLVIRTHSGNPYFYFKDDHNEVKSGLYDLKTLKPVKSEDVFYEVDGKIYKSHYSGFFQVNRWILHDLINLVSSFAQPKNTDVLLDVYCGVGIFALSLAEKVKKAMGVEILEESIEYAKKNAEGLGLTNTEFTAEPAETYMRRLVDEEKHIDICVVDPPRNGLTNKVVSAIKKLKPEKLIYVSCGPSTFARDARKFVDAGYEMKKIQPLDLFPHTKHFELVAEFRM